MLSTFAIIFTLGLVIFVHELGHLLAAKITGVGAPRFSIGFGPATPIRWTWGETEFVVAWLPLGGYVKLATREQDDPTSAIEGQVEEEYPAEKLFENKSVGQRAFVMSAGVIMNILLAWVLHAGVLAFAGVDDVPLDRIDVVESALPLSGRDLADASGSRLVAVNGDTVHTWGEALGAIASPNADRLRFDFADHDPVVVPLDESSDREAVLNALRPVLAPIFGGIQRGGAADAAGIVAGDRVIVLNGDSVRSWNDMVGVVRSHPGDTMATTVSRGDSTFTVALAPEPFDTTLDGRDTTLGRIGAYASLGPTVRQRLALGPAVLAGASQTWQDLDLVFSTIRGLVAGRVSPKELAGPIGISQLAAEQAHQGFADLLWLIAVISVNLAVFNLLPVPVLDGGHLVFLLAERVRGKPLSLETRYRFMQLGMMLLLLLVVFVFYNDIRRFLGL